MSGGVDPGRATDERLVAARQRVDAFLQDLDHVGIEDLDALSIPVSDIAVRAPARTEAVRACDAAGLGPFLADARERARARVVQMYDRNMYQPTWAGLNWGRSLGTVDDRVAVAAAVEDAAIGTVAMDVASSVDVATLTEPLRLLVSMRPDDPRRSQFAGTDWTGRIGAALFLVFVITTVAVLGVMFGPIGWVLAAIVVIVAARAIRRTRSGGEPSA